MPAACVFIAASGTGGHLFPALHIARAITRLRPELEVEFIGSGRPLEEKIIDGAGFKRHVITTVGLKQRGIKGLLEFLTTLPRAAAQTRRLLKEKQPRLVIGVGGYVSFLPVTLARLRGIPAWIHEAELKPGLANFVLSLYASKVSLAFEDAKLPPWARTIYTGHPVREELKDLAQEQPSGAAPEHLLIIGGSQGARALDQAMEALAPWVKQRGLKVRHQCRAENIEAVRAAYAAHQIEAAASPFIEDMLSAYRWSDVVLARAGAGTIMEIGAANRPAVFVPFPYAQGQHQRANAMILARAGKALVEEEGEEFIPRLQAALSKIFEPSVHAAMRSAAPPARGLDAADMIAKGCLELMGAAG